MARSPNSTKNITSPVHKHAINRIKLQSLDSSIIKQHLNNKTVNILIKEDPKILNRLKNQEKTPKAVNINKSKLISEIDAIFQAAKTQYKYYNKITRRNNREKR